MQHGKINQALKLLSESSTNDLLKLSDESINQLLLKHPAGEPLHEEFMLHSPVKRINPIIFDEIDESLVMKAASRSRGAAGPSKLYGDEWRKILCSTVYGTASTDLRKAISRMAKLLCAETIEDHNSIESLLACTLIPLNKNPGVRPIGIGEVLRRLIGKVVMYVMKKDVIDSAGSLQLCAGQEAGCETAVHGMVDIWKDINTEGVLQVDASNAFNSINRAVMLHKIRIICPEIATYVINIYCQPSRLSVLGGKEIESREGTTQGDPIAIAVYALGLGPLLTQLILPVLHQDINNLPQVPKRNDNCVKHVAYADDLAGGGSIDNIKRWWDIIEILSPKIRYFANADKSWLIVKEEHLDKAK